MYLLKITYTNNNMKKEYYIISGKWTHKKDKAITLWRKNAAGYCLRKDWSGLFSEEYVKDMDGLDCIPIEKEIVEDVFFKMNYEGTEFLAIPNVASIRRHLGVTLKQLRRKYHHPDNAEWVKGSSVHN